MALAAEGRIVGSGSGEGTARLWETDTGRLLATLHGHTDTVWSVVLSADGQLVASGGFDGTVRLWEANTERPPATLPGHTVRSRWRGAVRRRSAGRQWQRG